MIKKLKQKKGETLVETLFSMLIAVLSMGILCMAVMTATNLNMQTREMDEKYNSELRAVESLEGDNEVKVLTITFKSEDGSILHESTTAEVTMYGGDESAFLSYDNTPVNEPEEDTP